MSLNETYSILAVVALSAGFISAITGGSGMIILPVLLMTGMPPHIALGTNKLYTTGSLLTSALTFMRRGLFNPRFWVAATVATLFGSLIGVGLTQLFSYESLSKILPLMILATTIYFLIPDKKQIIEATPIESLKDRGLTGSIIGILLGIYSGFFGAGTASIWTSLAMKFFNMEMLQACAIARFMCFISNISALITFALLGDVNLAIGFMLLTLGSIGSYFGSRFAIAKGSRYVRPLLIVSSLIMAGISGYQAWF